MEPDLPIRRLQRSDMSQEIEGERKSKWKVTIGPAAKSGAHRDSARG